MFHQIFKVCIVKPFILFIFKDTTYVFYPKGRKKISVWKIPIITNTQLSRKWTEIGSTLPVCRRVGFIKLARDFCTLQKALRGWEKPCRASWAPTDAVASCPSQAQCVAVLGPGTLVLAPPMAPQALLHITTGDAVRWFPSIPNHCMMTIFI